MIRQYAVVLTVRTSRRVQTGALDRAVRAVVMFSTAREAIETAIETGLDAAGAREVPRYAVSDVRLSWAQPVEES